MSVTPVQDTASFLGSAGQLLEAVGVIIIGGSGSAPGKPSYVISANPATIVTGQLALAAGVNKPLPGNALVNGVVIKSSPNNTANVLIGGSTVTTAADGTGNGYILAPGEAASFGVSNTNAIYAISTAAAVLSYEGN